MKASEFYIGPCDEKALFASSITSKEDVRIIIGEAASYGDQCVLTSINKMVDRGVGVMALMGGMGKDHILLRQAQEGLSDDEVEALADLRSKIVDLLRDLPLDQEAVMHSRLARKILQRGKFPVELRASNPQASLLVDALAPEGPRFDGFGFDGPEDVLDAPVPTTLRGLLFEILGIEESEVKKIMAGAGCGCREPDVEAEGCGDIPEVIARLLETIGSPDEMRAALEQMTESLESLTKALVDVEVVDFNFDFGVTVAQDDPRVLRFSVSFE